ncbi:MAG: methyltransferase domain-containing protein [Anaerolineales bacterium]
MQNREHKANSARRSLPKRFLVIFLRIFFKLLYHQFAWTYDGVACVVSLGAWQKWVRSLVPYIDSPNVLEIGFGPGHLLVELSQKGITTFGLDESQQMVKLAKNRLERKRLPWLIMRGEAQALPLADECMYQVVMTFPAEYILNPTALSETRRILIKGGKVLILPFAWITGHTPWHRLAAWVNRISGEAPALDERALDPLKEAGFAVGWEMKDFGSSEIVLIHLVKQ